MLSRSHRMSNSVRSTPVACQRVDMIPVQMLLGFLFCFYLSFLRIRCNYPFKRIQVFDLLYHVIIFGSLSSRSAIIIYYMRYFIVRDFFNICFHILRWYNVESFCQVYRILLYVFSSPSITKSSVHRSFIRRYPKLLLFGAWHHKIFLFAIFLCVFNRP